MRILSARVDTSSLLGATVFLAILMAFSYSGLLIKKNFTPVSSSAQTTGANYYVSNSGNDGNDGLSPGSAWATLNKVNQQTFKPGDTVNFERGSSWTGELQIRSSGISGSPVIFQAYGTGASPNLSNPGPTGSYTVVIRLFGNYVTIKDFFVHNAHEAGVRIMTGSNNNRIENIEAADVGVGVYVDGQNNLVTQTYAHDLRMIVNTQGGDDDYGAIGYLLTAPNNEVSYSRCVNCRAPSYDYGYDGGTVELYANADGSYIHHNYGKKTNGFIEVGGGSARNVKVAYNVSDNNFEDFACLHTGGTFASVLNDFRIENNTVIKTIPGGYRLLLCMDVAPSAQELLVRNNIFYTNIKMATSGGFTHENNLYYMVGGIGVGYSISASEQKADPRFVDLAGGNYHLKSTSPAIDRGLSLGYANDFDDIAIPQGAKPDEGAFEFDSPTNTPTPTQPIATPTSTGSSVYYPVADAFVHQSNPSSNYGGSSNLKADGSPILITYLKFDLIPLAGKTITSAKFQLRVSDPTAGVQSIHQVANTSWGEKTVTYSNRPVLGSVLTTLNGGTLGNWIEVDLTAFVASKTGSVFTIGVDQSSSDNVFYYSRETSSKPKMTVFYQ